MGLTYVVSAPGVFCGIAFAFACLLDIGLLDILCGGTFKFFSSGPTKASTAGINAGTERPVFLFIKRMLRVSVCALSNFMLMALFTLMSSPSKRFFSKQN